MITLAETLDMRDGLDSIEAETIEKFMTECNTLFTGEKGGIVKRVAGSRNATLKADKDRDIFKGLKRKLCWVQK